MAWIKVETSVARNPKLIQAGPAAAWLWLCGIAYCSEGLTDGFIAAEAVEFLGVRGARRFVPQLVDAGLWRPVEGGWRVHDYLEYHRPADEVRRIREERRTAGARGGAATAARRGRGSPASEHLAVANASNLLQQGAEATVAARSETEVPVETEAEERQTGARGRARPPRYAYEGRALAITPGQHEHLVRMANGVDLDWIGDVYPRWNRELEASGEPFDTLVWCIERLKRELRIGREGHGPRPRSAEDEAAIAEIEASQRTRRQRDEAKQAEREELAESVLALLSDDERSAVEAEAVESLESFRTRMASAAYQDALTRARRIAILARCSEADLKARVRAHLRETKPLRVRPLPGDEGRP